MHYLVEFDFIENGRKCHTAYAGPAAKSEAEAEQVAREWFGFEKDGITVLGVKITKLD